MRRASAPYLRATVGDAVKQRAEDKLKERCAGRLKSF